MFQLFTAGSYARFQCESAGRGNVGGDRQINGRSESSRLGDARGDLCGAASERAWIVGVRSGWSSKLGSQFSYGVSPEEPFADHGACGFRPRFEGQTETRRRDAEYAKTARTVC